MTIYKVYTNGRPRPKMLLTFSGFLDYLSACQNNHEAGCAGWIVESWEVCSSVYYLPARVVGERKYFEFLCKKEGRS